MKPQARRQLRLNAKRRLDGYGIPWQNYNAGEINHKEDDFLGQVIFTHKESGRQIVVGQVWYEATTGEILRVGSNYGCLTL